MTQNRTVPTLVGILLVCAGLVGWLFYPSTEGGPSVSPVAVSGVQAEGADPAAAMSTQGAADLKAGSGQAGARTALAAPTTGPAGRFQLGGRLVGLDGAPLAGLELAFAVVRSGALIVDIPMELEVDDAPRARTGSDGRFSLLLPAGIERQMSLPEQPVYLRDTEGARSLRIAGLTADRDLGDVVVGRAARLAGRVLDEVSGRACAGVRVSLGRGLAMMMREAAPATDAEGRFAFENLRPGEYTLTTASPEWLPARVKVELGDGEAVADFTVRLAAGGSIAGVVLDDTGKPVSGLKVGAERARTMGGGVDMRSTSTAEATVTDVAGRFVLRGIDPGTVSVSAWGKGHATARADGVAVGTTDVVLTARRLGRIAGVVVDGEGAPVAGSTVQARAEEGGLAGMRLLGGAEVRTDAKGEFVVDDLAPGACTLVVTGEHRRSETGPLTVVPGEMLRGIRVIVQRGATVVVTVVDGAGQPVEGAKVDLAAVSEAPAAGGWQAERRVSRRVRAGGPGGPVMIDDGQDLGSAVTDAQGIARIGGLAAGRVHARVRHTEFFPAQSPELSVPERGEVATKVAVAPGGFVTVAAFDLDRAPVPDASFKLVGPQEAGTAAKTETGRCDATGVAAVGPLEPGTYRACLVLPAPPMQLGDGGAMVAIGGADGRDLDDSAAMVTVVAEKTASVNLTRPMLATFRGVVRDAQGPVSGARVQLVDEGGPDLGFLTSGPRAMTDGEGRFELKDLPAGGYDVRFGLPDALAMSEAKLTIQSGQSLVERELFLRTGTIRLIVRDEDGVPVARAQVTLERAGRAQSAAPARPTRAVMIMARTNDSDQGTTTTSISSGTPSVATDIEGVAELVRVPEGDYTVRIEHARHAVTRKPDVKVLDGGTVDLGTITMSAGGSFVGQVLSADGQPVDFAMVEITPLGGGEPRRETAMGGAIRVTGLAAGRYRARARVLNAADWGPPVEVDLGKGERQRLDLRGQ